MPRAGVLDAAACSSCSSPAAMLNGSGVLNASGGVAASSLPKSPQSESISSVGGIIDCKEAVCCGAWLPGAAGTGSETALSAAGSFAFGAEGTASETIPGEMDSTSFSGFSAVPCCRLALALLARLLIAVVTNGSANLGLVARLIGAKERPCRCVQ